MSLLTNVARAFDPNIDIEIPVTAFLPCPAAKDFAQVRVRKCPACPAFHGLVDTAPQAAQPMAFVDRYRVFCGHPIARRMAIVETD